MNTLARSVRVLGLGLVVLGASACSTGPQSADGSAGAVRIGVENKTSVTLEVSLHLGEKHQGRDGATLYKHGEVETIVRGSAAVADVRRITSFVPFDDRQEKYVTWIRIEAITPTWRERAVQWYELLGPPPQTITVVEQKTNEGVRLAASSTEVPITPVPYQYWPLADLEDPVIGAASSLGSP